MSITKQAISDSLFHLLETIDYKKISIKSICEDAHISRNAFYYHFENKEAVIQWFVDRQFLKYSLPFFKISTDNISTKSFFSYIYDNKVVYKRIFQIDDGHLLFDCLKHAYSLALLKENIKEYGYEKKKDRRPVDPKVCMWYANAGTAAVVVEWIRDDMRIPIEKIAGDMRIMLTKSLEDVRDIYLY